jgi:hypothetical protein
MLVLLLLLLSKLLPLLLPTRVAQGQHLERRQRDGGGPWGRREEGGEKQG